MKYGANDLVVPVLVWREADYERAKALSDDEMFETYARWQEEFRMALRAIPAGAIVVKIVADPDEVAEWCRSQGREINAANRAAWATMKFCAENGIEDMPG